MGGLVEMIADILTTRQVMGGLIEMTVGVEMTVHVTGGVKMQKNGGFKMLFCGGEYSAELDVFISVRQNSFLGKFRPQPALSCGSFCLL